MVENGLRVESVDTDVLCLGGGIAGLMTAIRAGELGARVIVAEKGNALASGRGCAGNDHFWCYIPEVHGTDLEAFLKECLKGPKLRLMQSGTGAAVLRTFIEHSFDMVKLWDSWGIPMKYQEKWEFAGHTFPGEILNHLKYAGKRQKRVLVGKAREATIATVRWKLYQIAARLVYHARRILLNRLSNNVILEGVSRSPERSERGSD